MENEMQNKVQPDKSPVFVADRMPNPYTSILLVQYSDRRRHNTSAVPNPFAFHVLAPPSRWKNTNVQMVETDQQLMSNVVYINKQNYLF